MTLRRLLGWMAVLLVIGGLLIWDDFGHRAEPATTVRPAIAVEDALPSKDRTGLLGGLFHGALLQTVDGDDFAQGPSYRRLLEGVHAMAPEEFSARVSRRLVWASAVEEPERWRGEFVRLRGLVADTEVIKVQGGSEQLETVQRVFLGQTDGSDMVVVDSVVPLPALELRKDVLDVEGVFYRTLGYESRTGEMREVPYLIGRNAALLARTVVVPSEFSWPGLAALVVASLLCAWAITRFGGRWSLQRWKKTHRDRHAMAGSRGRS